MKTDLVQLRKCVDKQLKSFDLVKNPNQRGACLKTLKYCAFANQIIENHKIINYHIFGDAFKALNSASLDNIQLIFYNYFSPQYRLLKKYTDGALSKKLK